MIAGRVRALTYLSAGLIEASYSGMSLFDFRMKRLMVIEDLHTNNKFTNNVSYKPGL